MPKNPPRAPRATSPFASLLSGVGIAAKKAHNTAKSGVPKTGKGKPAPASFAHLRQSGGAAPVAAERATFADRTAAAQVKATTAAKAATPSGFAARMAAAVKKVRG